MQMVSCERSTLDPDGKENWILLASCLIYDDLRDRLGRVVKCVQSVQQIYGPATLNALSSKDNPCTDPVEQDGPREEGPERPESNALDNEGPDGSACN